MDERAEGRPHDQVGGVAVHLECPGREPPATVRPLSDHRAEAAPGTEHGVRRPAEPGPTHRQAERLHRGGVRVRTNDPAARRSRRPMRRSRSAWRSRSADRPSRASRWTCSSQSSASPSSPGAAHASARVSQSANGRAASSHPGPSTSATRCSASATGIVPSQASANVRRSPAARAHASAGSSPPQVCRDRCERQLRAPRLDHRVGQIAGARLGQAWIATAERTEEQPVGHHRVVDRVVVPQQRRPASERIGTSPCFGRGDPVVDHGHARPTDRHIDRDGRGELVEVRRGRGADVVRRNEHDDRLDHRDGRAATS